MRISITVKTFAAHRNHMTDRPVELPDSIGTTRDLIAALVRMEVASYNAKPEDARAVDATGKTLAVPLSEDAISRAAESGKISFGFRRGPEADGNAAIQNALATYGDGFFKIFVGDVELGGLDDPVAMHDGDRLTIIRLVMLSG